MTRVALSISGGIVSAGLEQVLSEGGCEVVAARGAVDLLRDWSILRPDVVVLDRDGTVREHELASGISCSHPGVVVIVVSAEDSMMTVFPAHHRGESYRAPLTEQMLVAAARAT